jgi:hypothetical protein
MAPAVATLVAIELLLLEGYNDSCLPHENSGSWYGKPPKTGKAFCHHSNILDSFSSKIEYSFYHIEKRLRLSGGS